MICAVATVDVEDKSNQRGTPSFIPGMRDNTACQGNAGTSTGVNIAPGSDDDGWIVPDPVKLSDGSTVQMYKDGEALHAAFEAIKSAKRRICLEVYIFAGDDTGKAFADLLCQKAKEGVQVFVIYDSLGSISTGSALFKQMRRAGVRLQEFHPVFPWSCKYNWRPWNRNHRKLLLIDNDIAGLGGLNVGAEYAGSWIGPRGSQKCDFWRDNAIGITGPSVRPLQQSFANSWKYATHGGKLKRTQLEYNLDFQDGDLAVMASSPTRRSHVTPILGLLVDGAKHSVDLTMAYFAPPEEFIDGLCRAAKRGARVRLMLPGKCDVPLLLLAARSFYEKLLTAGVDIYERQGVVLHAKTMVIDREIVVIGSTNLDYRSIEYNLELSAMIRHKQFGVQGCDMFENDMRYAKQIKLTEWRRRPILDRFGQWAVNRSRYLL